jgi:hypothetical protein
MPPWQGIRRLCRTDCPRPIGLETAAAGWRPRGSAHFFLAVFFAAFFGAFFTAFFLTTFLTAFFLAAFLGAAFLTVFFATFFAAFFFAFLAIRYHLLPWGVSGTLT